MLNNDLYSKMYNPDVLSTLANLSSDEVFTPPEVVNNMLDLLPDELWSNPDAKFLDPACKSGVFLREIAKRLIDGLEDLIPDLQERLDHIFHNQLYGIAITELTSLLSRRSVYGSKYPNSIFSFSTFDNPVGNIKYNIIEHSWEGTRCKYCGAAKSEYDRSNQLETHAYEFIHKEKPEEIFNMKFDVIVGNPPYQLNDGGGRGDSASPIYDKFVEQAKKLKPRYLIMIIPARWYSGGKGLNQFRKNMLSDTSIKEIHDFPETSDCFPGLNIRGGICYFLWSRDYNGPCKVVNYKNGLVVSETTRYMKEDNLETFVRYNIGISILRKVRKLNEETMDLRVSARKPFGLESNFSNFYKEKTKDKNIKLYRFGDDGYISIDQVLKNKDLVKKIKVINSKASPGGDDYPHQIIAEPIIAGKNTASTETYLVIDIVESIEEAQNLASYMKTKFFRFLMSLIKNTQNISRGVYAFVPVQDLSGKATLF
jgi:site-specific DNA-methyltransferase (adenine-specific)